VRDEGLRLDAAACHPPALVVQGVDNAADPRLKGLGPPGAGRVLAAATCGTV